MKEFLRKKNIIFSAKRYGIDALGAMAQGLFASLLIGTIISTLGEQLGIGILCNSRRLCERSNRSRDGNLDRSSTSVSATCIVFTGGSRNGKQMNLGVPEDLLRFWSLRFLQREFGKLVSKETKIDIIVTPFVTICVGGSAFTGMCTGDRSSGKYRRNCDHVGD